MKFHSVPLLAVAAALVASGAESAIAKDGKTASTNLPGVRQPEPIVKPLPSDRRSDRKNSDGWVRVGDWDVKVSGAVSVDIGTGIRSNDR